MSILNKKAELADLVGGMQNLSGADLAAAVDKAAALEAEIVTMEKADAMRARVDAPGKRVIAPAAPAAAAAPAVLDAFFGNLPRGARAIQNATGDVFQESAAGDGGYLLPVDKRALISLLLPADTCCAMCDQVFTQSNSITVPVDEDADWSTSLAAGDVAEGAALTESKAAFKSLDLTLAKRGVLTRVTREMLEDNSGIGEYAVNKIARKLAWKLHTVCISAFLASGAKKTIAKTTGAAVGSAPDLANIQKMWTGMLPDHRAGAVWLANPQLETVLQTLSVTGSGGGVFPIYIPAGGLSEAPYGKLYGRPVMFMEGLPAIGTEGDLTLVAPSQFYLAMKQAGPRLGVSVDAEFKNDVVVYSGYIRAVCKSKFSAPITRADGSTAGTVVTVATR